MSYRCINPPTLSYKSELVCDNCHINTLRCVGIHVSKCCQTLAFTIEFISDETMTFNFEGDEDEETSFSESSSSSSPHLERNKWYGLDNVFSAHLWTATGLENIFTGNICETGTNGWDKRLCILITLETPIHPDGAITESLTVFSSYCESQTLNTTCWQMVFIMSTNHQPPTNIWMNSCRESQRYRNRVWERYVRL